MFSKGDRVRIDIPSVGDPEFRFHREHGKIIEVIDDSAGMETGDERDSCLYRVKLENGEIMDFRWRDLRLPNHEET